MKNIVLAHGVLGFERFGVLRYFNRVADHLRVAFPGSRVITPAVPLIGTVERRAEALASAISRALTAGILDDTKPLNLIGHSMGGLDARFVVSNNVGNLARKVATVTCIGTPHRGSPVASLLNLFNPLGPFSVLSKIDLGEFEAVRAELNAVRDLAVDGATAIDERCPDRSGVRYENICGIGRAAGRSTSEFFRVPFSLLTLASGPNDGVVPLESATRDRPPFAIWPADHADMIGHDLDDVPDFEGRAFAHLREYDRVVSEIAVP